MSWTNPFRRNDENTRHTWGYTFQWTPDHLTAEETHHLKFSYDKLADECLDRLDAISPPTSKELPRSRSRTPAKESTPPLPKRDLYELLKEHHEEDPKLNELWNQVNTIPDWVDWDQIARGQDVFYRYGGPALTALAYQSLLGGMGASRVTEVLARTGGFSPSVAKHRLYETTQHILQCTSSLSSIQPLGAGFASSLRVRLLHASVRRRILSLASSMPSYYSIENYGIPINDLDCIGTISTFSATLIWIGFPRQGIILRQQEIEDYIALWRLVAFYMGIPTSFFSTPHEARAIMESLMIAEINPSGTGKVLANNIILSLMDQPPAFASRSFLVASARWLNGDELVDALGLERVGSYWKALVLGQCVFFMGLCYLYRSIPFLDRRKIAALRKIFYQIIVSNSTHGLGTETVFDFKYIPSLDMQSPSSTSPNGKEAPGTPAALVAKGGIERRNLKTLILAGVGMAVAIGSVGWAGIKVGWGMWSLGRVVVGLGRDFMGRLD